MSTTTEAAGIRYKEGIQDSEEDARLGLKYVLLRMELAGVTEQDRTDLRELVSKACSDGDIAESAGRIQNAKSASPLAVAIAEIVSASPFKRAACLGAIFGAHERMFTSTSREELSRSGIEGAVTGAIAASGIASLDSKTQGLNLDEFLRRE